MIKRSESQEVLVYSKISNHSTSCTGRLESVVGDEQFEELHVQTQSTGELSECSTKEALAPERQENESFMRSAQVFVKSVILKKAGDHELRDVGIQVCLDLERDFDEETSSSPRSDNIIEDKLDGSQNDQEKATAKREPNQTNLPYTDGSTCTSEDDFEIDFTNHNEIDLAKQDIEDVGQREYYMNLIENAKKREACDKTKRHPQAKIPKSKRTMSQRELPSDGKGLNINRKQPPIEPSDINKLAAEENENETCHGSQIKGKDKKTEEDEGLKCNNTIHLAEVLSRTKDSFERFQDGDRQTELNIVDLRNQEIELSDQQTSKYHKNKFAAAENKNETSQESQIDGKDKKTEEDDRLRCNNTIHLAEVLSRTKNSFDCFQDGDRRTEVNIVDLRNRETDQQTSKCYMKKLASEEEENETCHGSKNDGKDQKTGKEDGLKCDINKLAAEEKENKTCRGSEIDGNEKNMKEDVFNDGRNEEASTGISSRSAHAFSMKNVWTLLLFMIQLSSGVPVADDIVCNQLPIPAIFGENLTLTCHVRTNTSIHFAWHREPSMQLLALQHKSSNDSKFLVSVEEEDQYFIYNLKILNLDPSDINRWYRCTNFDKYHEWYLNLTEFIYKPRNQDVLKRTFMVDGKTRGNWTLLQVYPEPTCELMAQQQHVITNDSRHNTINGLFKLVYTFDMPCRGNVSMKCDINGITVLEDIFSTNSTLGDCKLEDRSITSITLITVSIIILIIIIIITIWIILRRVKGCQYSQVENQHCTIDEKDVTGDHDCIIPMVPVTATGATF